MESSNSQVTLCDALDRILTKGVVANGDIVISVAGVELLYIGLRGIICAIDSLDQRPASLSSVSKMLLSSPGDSTSTETDHA